MDVAREQLARMRGMTGFYHRRFFMDVWLTTGLFLAALIAGDFGATRAFLLLPLIALMGAMMTAFDASYLMFARHYAAALETHINKHTEDRPLVAAMLEDAYLFRLNDRKIVTIGRHFTWFGGVTAFLTLMGIAGFLYGLALGRGTFVESADRSLYTAGVVGFAVVVLAVGVWWFVLGTGERRLKAVLDERFPSKD